jgi:hypothetical protein
VVAVVDTGCGTHHWLLPPTVAPLTEVLNVDGKAVVPVGIPDTGTETGGDVEGPLDGQLDAVSGHGTFIAGILRQVCPDADLLAVRAVGSDGAIGEGVIVSVLDALLLLVSRAILGEPDGQIVDVINLSMGYYHQSDDDDVETRALWDVLRDLAAAGVAVVVSAGNDATTRPTFPAGFAPASEGNPDFVPITSVGALNPDNQTRAAFSNAGDWVRTWAPGGNVFSTFPTTFNAGARAVMRMRDPDGGHRSTIDGDDFSGGFGLWSGSSFAAPNVGARIAQALVGSLDDPSTQTASDRVALVSQARQSCL